ncbi:hypothetical protein JXA40_05890 [bacterium]|nr:hypothetical protein [candidate division CSSED10-310 bacterium]
MRVRFCILCACLQVFVSVRAAEPEPVIPGGECIACHEEKSAGLVRQWRDSAHGRNGVMCRDCHGASADDPDGFIHYGIRIATLVTPNDCRDCHDREFTEMTQSYHARAGEILRSNDAYLAHVAAGEPAAIQGCESCHGANVRIDSDRPNMLPSRSWPNSGIGRLNPDGSRGSCNACHTRHSFSVAQARQPESCGKCHLGPDHPQREIYEESKHGNTYYTNIGRMNLESPGWVVGVDYYAAPTCSTCHMSATERHPVTHDVGRRISWTLRPPVSRKQDDWQSKRANMQDVCITCHGQPFVEGHYHQFDASVKLYNEKFAGPAMDIMNLVKSRNLLTSKADFSNSIEWIYWELWHHEGRRARHGASMMGPDYTWWHGFYDVAQHFYFKFLPAARAYNDPEVNAYIAKLLAGDPMHTWMRQETTQLKSAIQSGGQQEIYRRFFDRE